MNSIRSKVRQATGQSNVAAGMEVVIANVNQVLRGWGGYFRDGSSSRKFAIIDSYVHERLAIFDSTKHGRHGRNWQRHTTAWLERLGIYRLSRTKRTRTAHA
jgi:RNA-directed DNA polymerase